MPVYPVKCKNPKCGHACEVFSRASECHMLRCPQCGSLSEQDYAAKGGTLQYRGNEWRDMGRRDLLTEGVAPRDAEKAAKELEPYGLSHVYQKNGDCVVDSKGEMQRLAAARKDINARKAMQNT